MNNVYLNALGVINALGADADSVRCNLLAGVSPGMGEHASGLHDTPCYAGAVIDPLPEVPESLATFSCRNNRLTLAALMQIQDALGNAISRFGAHRIGVVMGTSTSGVDEMEKALFDFEKYGTPVSVAAYTRQEIGNTAEFLARVSGVSGPSYAHSSACSSSGKVFASARGLIQMGLCDAVLVGGTDSLCELTLKGFAALEAISSERSNPFSVNRKGINVGEGAALFLMSRMAIGPALVGVGESSDACHMASPDPSGSGAKAAMKAALEDAQLTPEDIQYVNLHGTGTVANDLMESHGVHDVFGANILCSSSKPLTGHTLGAAGATEAAICWLLLTGTDRRSVAPQLFDGEVDPALSKIRLCESEKAPIDIEHIMSNSFAFGGNNVSIILRRNEND